MVKKKVVRRKVQSPSVVSRVQSGVKKMQRDAQTLLTRARKEATRLSHEQRRGLDRVVTEAKRLRGDLDTLVKRASKDLESQSRRLLSTLEKDVEKRLAPIVSRLMGPSRLEVQSLAHRVYQLEQLLKQHSHAAPSPTSTPPLSSPPDAVGSSAGD